MESESSYRQLPLLVLESRDIRLLFLHACQPLEGLVYSILIWL